MRRYTPYDPQDVPYVGSGIAGFVINRRSCRLAFPLRYGRGLTRAGCSTIGAFAIAAPAVRSKAPVSTASRTAVAPVALMVRARLIEDIETSSFSAMAAWEGSSRELC